ncbi:MAG TPA: YbhB/YbcL family Raf kinase inhibitor-like protein [Dehalococcoidia bacterium]|nr:YbhB/YbcL family Raf kinase inhibitor-like protein [Dehalococcoidia bacterium]
MALLLCAALTACGSSKPRPGPATPSPPPAATPGRGLTVSSTAFTPDGPIPPDFTCDGANVSPPLSWSVPARGAAAYAVVVDDPDAPGGSFTHWLLLDLPATATSLPQGVPAAERPAIGGVQGRNDGGVTGYSGPCPSGGPAHYYRFTVYALDQPLNLAPVPGKGGVLNAMRGHILAQGTLVGTYQRAGR